MSEQFAIQTEDFETTNDRLDSILDRLNALGQSVTERKDEAARSLASVPDLPEPDIYDGLYDDPTPVAIEDTADVAVLDAPLLDQPVLDEHVEVEADTANVFTAVDGPDLVPPSMPPLGLVPPSLPGSVQASEATDTDTEATDTDAETLIEDDLLSVETDGEAFGALDPVDTGADFESVTALTLVPDLEPEIEPPADDEFLVTEDELPPADLETGDADWAETENEAGAFDGVVEAEQLIDEDPSMFDSPGEETEIGAPEITAAEIGAPEITAAEVSAPEITAAEVSAPAISARVEAPEPEALPAVEEAGIFQLHAPPEETDIFGLQPAPQNVDVEPAVVMDETPVEAPTVVKAIETEPVQVDTPSKSASIFGSSSGSNRTVSEPAPTPAETDGWVSHNGAEEVESSTPVASPVTDLFAVEPTEQAEWPTEELSTNPFAATDSSVSLFDQETAEQTNPARMADEVEQVLGEWADVPTGDPLAELNPTDAPAMLADIDAPVDTSLDEVHSGIYESDDELPLLDFTGVYVEDESDVPTSVESSVSSSISVGRGELDNLRPGDGIEDQREALAKEKKGADWSPIFQLILVVGFGVAVLVFFWLQDPEAVADIQREFNAITGRD